MSALVVVQFYQEAELKSFVLNVGPSLDSCGSTP